MQSLKISLTRLHVIRPIDVLLEQPIFWHLIPPAISHTNVPVKETPQSGIRWNLDMMDFQVIVAENFRGASAGGRWVGG